MLVLDRILAIEDDRPDMIQMGLSTNSWAVIEKTGKKKDGSPASPSVLKQDRSKTLIKGDKKLTEVLPEKPVARQMDKAIAGKVKSAIAGMKGGKVVKGRSPNQKVLNTKRSKIESEINQLETSHALDKKADALLKKTKGQPKEERIKKLIDLGVSKLDAENAFIPSRLSFTTGEPRGGFVQTYKPTKLRKLKVELTQFKK